MVSLVVGSTLIFSLPVFRRMFVKRRVTCACHIYVQGAPRSEFTSRKVCSEKCVAKFSNAVKNADEPGTRINDFDTIGLT